MTRLQVKLTVPALALALAACASPPKPDSSPPATAGETSAPKPEAEYEKPVRMNGRGKVSSISLEKFFLLQQSGDAMIIDARPAFFYNLAHIPGATNLPKTNCDTRIHKREDEIKAALAKGKTIVVYCTNLMCHDARTVARHISGFGYPATIFSGGWESWKNAGMPIE